MSSLIDRQAAIEVASKKCYELRGVFGEIEDGLNELPTVDAIPVEWIREWNTQHSPLVAGYVAYMLLDWEKENAEVSD